MTYSTRELTKEEGEALTKDLQEVLLKHNCEMGVTSTIQLLKRVEAEAPTISPLQEPQENGNDTTEKTS